MILLYTISLKAQSCAVSIRQGKLNREGRLIQTEILAGGGGWGLINKRRLLERGRLWDHLRYLDIVGRSGRGILVSGTQIRRSSSVADYRPEPIRRYSKILHLVRFDFHGT